MNTRWILTMLIVALLGGGAAPAFVFAQAGAAAEPAADDEAMPRKDPFVAGLLQWMMPLAPLGFWYAGDTLRGIPPVALAWGGILLWTTSWGDFWSDHWEGKDSSSADFKVALGLTLCVVGDLWGILGAADTARDTNERLAAPEHRVLITPTRDGVAVAIRATF